MTEEEWSACSDPLHLVNWIAGETSARRLRLFAIACCRRVLHLEADPGWRAAVETAERYADELCTAEELATAIPPVNATLEERIREINSVASFVRRAIAVACLDPGYMRAPCGAFSGREEKGSYWVMRGGDAAAEAIARANADLTGPRRLGFEEALERERHSQCNVFRDIVGNPFQPLVVVLEWLAWNDGTLRKIAQAIYEERAFDRLPILADALEDAGCDNADLLAHCRSDGEHVRGCWVVDLLLGKS